MVIKSTFTLDAPRETVWKLLLDVSRLGSCIPGCERITQVAKNQFQARVHVKVAFIKTTFDVDIAIADLDPPRHFKLIGHGEEDERRSFLTAESSLDLSPRDGGRTQVAFHSRLDLGGRLGMIAHPAFRAKADELIAEFIRNLESQVALAISIDSTG